MKPTRRITREPKFYSKKAPFRIAKNGKKIWMVKHGRGIASEFMHQLVESLPELKGKLTLLYCRVSTPEQEKDGNLDDQVAESLKKLEDLGIFPEEVFCEQSTGSIFGWRPELDKAIDWCKRNNAVLIIRSRERLLRHRGYVSQEWDENPRFASPGRIAAFNEWPCIYEYHYLSKMLQGVRVFSIHDPDKGEPRSDSTKRGLRRGKKGGRPSKYDTSPGCRTRRREKLKPLALELKAQGLNDCEIARKLEMDFPNICPITSEGLRREWFKDLGNEPSLG